MEFGRRDRSNRGGGRGSGRRSKEREIQESREREMRERESRESAERESAERELRELKEKENLQKEKEQEETRLTLSKLRSIIEKNNKIIRYYAEGGYYKFIEIVSNEDSEKVLIYIPSKYPIKTSLDYPHIEIEIINPEEDIEVKPSSSELKDYSEIKIDGLESPPNLFVEDDEADKIVQYKNINIESSGDIREYLKVTNSQLERFRNCTNKIKYKFGILTAQILSVINRHNDIDHFLIKTPIKVNKELCIVLDLENYYSKIETISFDIRKVYVNFFSILTDLHNKEISELGEKLTVCMNLTKSIGKSYQDLQKYLETLNETTNKIKIINVEISKVETLENREMSNPSEVERSFKVNNFQKELSKKRGVKESALDLYRDIKNKYHLGLLNYDQLLFENIMLLKKIKDNYNLVNVSLS